MNTFMKLDSATVFLSLLLLFLRAPSRCYLRLTVRHDARDVHRDRQLMTDSRRRPEIAQIIPVHVHISPMTGLISMGDGAFYTPHTCT